ncbi:MAG: hypothetical protein ACOCWQ_05385, partial [Nanoarchaeota archaeon]
MKTAQYFLLFLLLVPITVAIDPAVSPTVQMVPLSPDSSENIICQVDKYLADADGNPVNDPSHTLRLYERRSIDQEWTLYATQSFTSVHSKPYTLAFPASATSPGDHIKCEVTAIDNAVEVQGGSAGVFVYDPADHTNPSRSHVDVFIPFGKYRPQIQEVNGNVTPGTGPVMVPNATSIPVVYRADCVFGECGDTNVTLFDLDQVIRPYTGAGYGFWTYSPPIQDAHTRYPQGVTSHGITRFSGRYEPPLALDGLYGCPECGPISVE